MTTDILADLIRGVAEVESDPRGLALHRLPAWARRQFPDPQLLAMEGQASGARLALRTTATRVDLRSHPNRISYVGADRPRGRIDVLVDGELFVRDVLTGGDRVEIDLQAGTRQHIEGPDHATSVALPAGDKLVEFWLPHNEALALVDLTADAPVAPAAERRPRWVHHGSSISQGSNALAPTEIWPVVAARRAGVELQNLGFGGNALVDPFVARTIRDAPADLISVKLGINVVNLDGMVLRTFVPAVHGFLDTIRDGHPDTPLVVVSPIFCGIHEKTPGPGAIDPASLGSGSVRFIATGDPADVARGALTLEVVRDALRGIVDGRADDANLHYLDGTDLYGSVDAEALPLPDALHPSSEAHALIGERFADRVLGAAIAGS